MAEIKEYKAEYLKELDTREFEADLIPGINEPFLETGINVKT